MSTVISAEHALASPHLYLLDVRGEAAYNAGHWPGAVMLDIQQWETLAKSPEGALDRAEVWERAIGALGINGSQPVVVYDDGRMTEAARAWFILQWHGVPVQVLDGGWPAALRLAGFAASHTARKPPPVHYRKPAGHRPIAGLVTRDALKHRLDGSLQILDARTGAEFRGEDLRANARGGHLPEARHLPHKQLLQEDGTLQPADALKAQLAGAGLSAGRPVVTHCDAGGRAALAALAAVHAGLPDVSAYYLSFSDWAADGTCPLA
jgi:thiosulfate/3-mercaptopyruvate sulfurtransferase